MGPSMGAFGGAGKGNFGFRQNGVRIFKMYPAFLEPIYAYKRAYIHRF